MPEIKIRKPSPAFEDHAEAEKQRAMSLSGDDARERGARIINILPWWVLVIFGGFLSAVGFGVYWSGAASMSEAGFVLMFPGFCLSLAGFSLMGVSAVRLALMPALELIAYQNSVIIALLKSRNDKGVKP